MSLLCRMGLHDWERKMVKGPFRTIIKLQCKRCPHRANLVVANDGRWLRLWKLKVITKFPYWACGRPMGKYRGKYPLGFMKRLKEIIQLEDKQIVHLFAGKSTKINDSDITIDINPDVNPDYVLDCKDELPLPDNFADITLVDPPYDSPKMIYGKKLYGTDYVPPYSFVKESVRITKPDGFICILHQLVYKTPKRTRRYAVIPITTGPNMRIRVLNIFQKMEDTK